MKILVVGQTPPWPPITVARIRLANILRGLQQIGEVDLFVLTDPGEPNPLLTPPGAGLRTGSIWAYPTEL